MFYVKQFSRRKNLYTQYSWLRCKSTIFALSSGYGKCGVAVIRVSGPEANVALKKVAGFDKEPQARYAYLKNIRNVKSREIIDKGLVLWFPGPKSFTGEDSCEFQVHGGVAVVKGILSTLGDIPSFRLAEPGEFTKRAFFNNKLNLTEVEGLADLLNAETEIQRKQAFLQAQGSLSNIYHQWKDQLSTNLAHLEALIDFEESENLTEVHANEIFKNILALRQKVQQHLSDGYKGEILRQGVKTVIIGKPNVGKSSLLNLLCGRQAAIVTPISGTTRDVLEVRLDIFGYPLILLDTAGLRKHSTDPIECEGMKKAVQHIDDADLIIIMMDVQDFLLWKQNNPHSNIQEYLKTYIASIGLEEKFETKKPSYNAIMFVMNKIDLGLMTSEHVVPISCRTNEGLDNFFKCIGEKLKQICGEPSKEHPTMNNARHRQHLNDSLNELNSFISKSNDSKIMDVVILAEHLRRTLKHLGKLTGAVTTDQILDIIFRDFCIGK